MIRRHPSFVAIVAALASVLIIGILRLLLWRYSTQPAEPGCGLTKLP